MTIFPWVVETHDPFIQVNKQYEEKQTVDNSLPSKAAWVIRNASYYEPKRTHYEE